MKNLSLCLLFISCGIIPAACGNPNAQHQHNTNTIKLAGSWQASSAEIYVFHDDGRFNHFSTQSKTEGRFTASGGKIYFTNIVYEKGETWEKKYPDAVYEYEIGKDNDGDYLNIANFLYGVTSVDISTAYTFRKAKQKNDISETAANKSTNSFQLKIYHGFDFPNKRVAKYGSNSGLTDLRFYQQTRRTGVFAYLGAAKIREFDNPPTGLSAAQVDGWNDYSFSPKTGAYYVIRSRDGRHYLLHLKKFDNQARAAGHWLLELEWKEITI